MKRTYDRLHLTFWSVLTVIAILFVLAAFSGCSSRKKAIQQGESHTHVEQRDTTARAHVLSADTSSAHLRTSSTVETRVHDYERQQQVLECFDTSGKLKQRTTTTFERGHREKKKHENAFDSSGTRSARRDTLGQISSSRKVVDSTSKTKAKNVAVRKSFTFAQLLPYGLGLLLLVAIYLAYRWLKRQYTNPIRKIENV